MTTDAEEADKWLMSAKEHLIPALSKSDMFVSLFSEGYRKSPKCALELGLSILMEKPLLFFVPRGVSVPKALERVAEKIVYYDEGISPEKMSLMVQEEIAALKINKP